MKKAAMAQGRSASPEIPSAATNDYSETRLRVRYAETDQMGVAYHSHYLVWFEAGRTDYCRQKGFTYAEMEATGATFLPVIEAQCTYRKPLHYDDDFIVRTRVTALRSRSVTFSYRLVSADNGSCLAEGFTRHAVTDASGSPKRMPVRFLESLQAPGRDSTGAERG